MDFVTQLMTKSTAELSSLEWAVGVVLLATMGISAAFVFIRLGYKALDDSHRRYVEDWYKNNRWQEDDY